MNNTHTHTQRRGFRRFHKFILVFCYLQFFCLTKILSQYYFNLDWSAEAGYLIEEEFADMYIYEDSIYILGNTFDGASQKLLFSKYAPDGSLIYEKKIQSGTNLINLGYRIYEKSGVFYLTGITAASSSSDYDIMVLKYLADGTEIYNISYNHSSDRDDYPVEINADENGNAFLCAGITSLENDLNFGFIVYDSSGTNMVETIYDSGNLDDKPFLMGRDGDYFNIIGTSGYNDTILNVISILYEEDGTPLDSTEIVQLNTAGVQALGVEYGADNHFMFSYFRNGQDSSGIYTRRYDDTLGQVFADSFYMQEAIIVRGQIVGGDSTMYVGFVSEKGGMNNLKVLEYDMAWDIAWSYGIEDIGKRMYMTKDEDSIIIAYQTSEDRLSVFKLNDEGKKIWQTEFQKSVWQVYKLIQNSGSFLLSSKQSSAEYELSHLEYIKRPMAFEQDTSGKNLYVEDEFVIRFRPSKLDTGFIDDPNRTFGKIGEVITDTTLIDTLTAKLNYGNSVADWKFMKIFPFFNTTDKKILSRFGDSIPLPTLWSALILQTPPSPGRNADSTMDSLQTISRSYIYYSHLNYAMHTSDEPVDEYYGTHQHSLHAISGSGYDLNADINMDVAWEYESNDGKEVKVGVFDNGLYHLHEDFGANDGTDYGGIAGSVVKSNKNVVNMPYQNMNMSDEDIEELENEGSDHGTKVSGIIAALRNNGSVGNEIGIAGIGGTDASETNANQISLFSYKVGYADNISLTAYANALGHAINPEYSLLLDVYNYSLVLEFNGAGAIASMNLIYELIELNYFAGIIQVASRGNTGGTDLIYPACFNDRWILSVGASDEDANFLDIGDDTLSNLGSSFGEGMDIIAPGETGMTYTTDAGQNSYSTFAATSCASPHVAGVAAYLELNQALSLFQEDIEQILECSAYDFTGQGYEPKKGWGLLDAGEALKLVNGHDDSGTFIPHKLLHMSVKQVNSWDECTWDESDDCPMQIAGVYQGFDFESESDILFGATIKKTTETISYNICDDLGVKFLEMCGNGKYALWPRFSASDFWGAPVEQSGTNHVTPVKDFILEINEGASDQCTLVFTLTGYRYIIEEVIAGKDSMPDEFPELPFEINSFNGDHIFELSLIVVDSSNVNPDNDFEYIPEVSLSDLQDLPGSEYIYPNPSANDINIMSDRDFKYYEIFNIDGQIKKRGDYSTKINISELTNGIYLLKAHNYRTNQLMNIKFIVLK